MDPEREQIDDEGRNPTQQRIDAEGPQERLADVDWDENEPSPNAGEEGTDPTV